MVSSAEMALKLISLVEQCKLEEVQTEVEDREGCFYRGVVLFDPDGANTRLYGLRTTEAKCGVYVLIDSCDRRLRCLHNKAEATLGAEGSVSFSSFSGDQEKRRSQTRGSPGDGDEPHVTRQYFMVNGALDYRATVWKRKTDRPLAVIMTLRPKESRRKSRHQRSASAPAGSAAAEAQSQDCCSDNWLSDNELADELFQTAAELPDEPYPFTAPRAGAEAPRNVPRTGKKRKATST